MVTGYKLGVALVTIAVSSLFGAVVSSDLSQPATASIDGTVVADDVQAQPIERVTVTITGREWLAGLTAITDAAGRFHFGAVPAGSYRVTATKAAYITTTYGVGRGERTLVTVDATRSVNVTIRLPRGGSIAGSLRDADGRAVPDVEVMAYAIDAGSRSPRRVPALVRTDDRGQYRIFGLESGPYVVLAVVGRFNQVFLEMTPAVVDAKLAALQARSAASRGTGTTRPTTTSNNLKAVEDRLAPVFYPGTADPSRAQVLQVETGVERLGVDFIVLSVRSSVIEGTVSSPVPAAALAFSIIPLPWPDLPHSLPTFQMAPGSAGIFSYTGVTPGKYLVLVRNNGGDGSPLEAPSRFGGAGRGGMRTDASIEPMAAASEVVISEGNASVALSFRPLSRFAGRIRLETSQSDQQLPRAGIRLTLEALQDAVQENWLARTLSKRVSTTVAMDGSFALTGIAPGEYVLTASTPTGHWLRSVLVDGDDVLDRPLRFADGERVSGAVAVLSDRHTRVTGTLLGTGEQDPSTYTVVVLPADRTLWTVGSRRIARTGVDNAQHFSFVDLPPGRYLIGLIKTSADLSSSLEAQFLEDIASLALEFSLSEGETRVQDFRISARSQPE